MKIYADPCWFLQIFAKKSTYLKNLEGLGKFIGFLPTSWCTVFDTHVFFLELKALLYCQNTHTIAAIICRIDELNLIPSVTVELILFTFSVVYWATYVKYIKNDNSFLKIISTNCEI